MSLKFDSLGLNFFQELLMLLPLLFLETFYVLTFFDVLNARPSSFPFKLITNSKVCPINLTIP